MSKHIVIAGCYNQAAAFAAKQEWKKTEWEYMDESRQVWGHIIGPDNHQVHFVGAFWRNEAVEHFLIQRELYRQLEEGRNA